MKSLFSTAWDTAQANFWLLVARIAVCGFMLTHGVPKFTSLVSGKPIQFADPFGLGETASFLLVIFAEFICSIFILMGFATRIAAFLLFFTMTIAVFYAHADDPFSKKEKALLYMVIYLLLMVFGAGKYSVDQMISGGGRKRR